MDRKMDGYIFIDREIDGWIDKKRMNKINKAVSLRRASKNKELQLKGLCFSVSLENLSSK